MTDEKTILIVNASESEKERLLTYLDGFRLLVEADEEKAFARAQEEEVHLVLLEKDSLPAEDCSLCRLMKGDSRTGDIPILFILPEWDEDAIEQVYISGAADYITRPSKPRELLSRVNTQIRLHYLSERLEHLSLYDQMTGMLNRRRFFELGLHVFDTSSLNLYALMMDIDRFKGINDTFGHPTGDRVIQAVAGVMKGTLGNEAILGRIGGEEFALLFHESSDDEAFATIEKVRKEVEKLTVKAEDKTELSLTISGGICKCTPRHKTLDMLMKDAYSALYESKEKGSNQSIFRA